MIHTVQIAMMLQADTPRKQVRQFTDFFALIFVTTFSLFARLELFLRLPCLIKIMEIGVITRQILLSNLQYAWESNIRIH